MGVTPDGRYAVSRSQNNTLQVWNLAQGVCYQTLSGHTDWVLTVRMTLDGCHAVSGSMDNTLRVWNIRSGECIGIIQGYVSSISHIRPDGSFVYRGGRTGGVILLTPLNFVMTPPIVTPLQLWLYRKDNNQGRWDDNITTICKWCGKRFSVTADILDVIRGITRNVNLSPDQSPCFELPDEAWDEPKLLSKCPLCHQPLKFNPFIVDNRGRW